MIVSPNWVEVNIGGVKEPVLDIFVCTAKIFQYSFFCQIRPKLKNSKYVYEHASRTVINYAIVMIYSQDSVNILE